MKYPGRRWASRHAPALQEAAEPHPNDRDPHRRLNIGFVSGNLTSHPEGRLLRPVLAYLDREQFETTVYSGTGRPDTITATLRQLADRWRDIRLHPDGRVARWIRQDKIDILIDLTGHFGNNRMLLMARKPAPVQAIHFGYPGTTGLEAVNWRITDAHADPLSETAEGERAAYTLERLVRVRNCAWCYEAPQEAQSVGDLPARKNGFITFACANNAIKVTPQAITLWAQILNAVPHSRLQLLADGNKRVRGEPCQPGGYLLKLFEEHGIDPSRVNLSARRPRGQYFEWIHSADIALDTFPYNGGVTSCDTLYMGVPLISIKGDSYWSRQGSAILSHVGLPQLLAATLADYVQIAVQRAGDLVGLCELRRGLRARLMESPLGGSARFAAGLGEAYRAMWKAWCRAGP